MLKVTPTYEPRKLEPGWAFSSMNEKSEPTTIYVHGNNFYPVDIVGNGQKALTKHYYCKFGNALPVKAIRLSNNLLKCHTVRHKPGIVQFDVILPGFSGKHPFQKRLEFKFVRTPLIEVVQPLVVVVGGGNDPYLSSDIQRKYPVEYDKTSRKDPHQTQLMAEPLQLMGFSQI
jgi:hypothetical protein